MEERRQVPIWFFVGTLISVYGVIVLMASIYATTPVSELSHLVRSAGTGWGLFMLIFGGVFMLAFRRSLNATEDSLSAEDVDPVIRGQDEKS